MDLRSIRDWTRERLEEEARRLGMEEVESLPRAELVLRLIASGGREGLRRASLIPAVKKAQEILGAAYAVAHSAAPRQVEALRSFTRRLPEVARSLSTWPPQAPSPPSGRVPRYPESPFDREYYTPPGAVTSAGQAPGEREPAEPLSVAAPCTRRFVEEPVRTLAMARILAEQGHRGLALSVYRDLMSSSPDDEVLRAEAEKVGRGEKVAEIRTAVGMLSPEMFKLGQPGDENLIGHQALGAGGLKLSWRVNAAGVRRAGAVLKQPGELAVRLICVVPGGGQVVRSEVREHGPVKEEGDWTAEQVPPSSRCLAAIGLRAEGRFVSIAHAEVQPG